MKRVVIGLGLLLSAGTSLAVEASCQIMVGMVMDPSTKQCVAYINSCELNDLLGRGFEKVFPTQCPGEQQSEIAAPFI